MDDIKPIPTQQTPQTVSASKGKRISTILKKKWWILVLALLVVGGVAFLLKGYIDTKQQLSKLSDTKVAAQADGQALVKDISKYFTLPDETPTVATVSDLSKLKDQEFFKDAKSGDKVLIFPNAGRALLYRPSTQKVIEYSKVNLNTSSEGTSEEK